MTEWAVCNGARRAAIKGTVNCPIRGTAVGLGGCATCRWLEDADEDRFASWTCTTGESSDRAPIAVGVDASQVEPTGAMRDGSLVIELL